MIEKYDYTLMKRYDSSMYNEVSKWFKEHRGDNIPEDLLSEVGFIIPGVAVGFLIKTNTSMCLFEPFITNPEASKEDRDWALAFIVTCLEHEALRLGYKSCYGIATAPTMIEHGRKLGWRNRGPYIVITKELT